MLPEREDHLSLEEAKLGGTTMRRILGVLTFVTVIGIIAMSVAFAEESRKSAQSLAPPSALQADASSLDAFDSTSTDLPNFQTVIPGQVFRGGAPTPQGVQALARGGIKTIIDLRNEDPRGSAREYALATSLGIKDVRVPLSAYLTPQDTTIATIETSLMADATLRPIFVHCHYGEDRTGLVIGLFRVFKQNPAYTPPQAYGEMLHYGFHPELRELANYFFAKTQWHP